ncbi:hypothetical protein ACIQ9E_11060 [Streptomyces sp. NPDC094448]|uniref:hypothetical protein n=1 Tax=Streptomyces sp. NPDC094448 TaxID=3366063 RepID=UPI0037F3FD15
MRNLIHRVLNRLRTFLNPPTHVVVLVPAPPLRTDPWTRPWTSPDKDQAQAVLRARARRRRVIVAAHGIRLEGLLARAPEPVTAACCVCGRATTAPVEVRPGRTTCPEHITDALTTAPGASP